MTKIKVTHVLGKFNRGGVEVLLKEIFLNTNHKDFEINFVLLGKGKGVYDDLLIEKGASLNIISRQDGIFTFIVNLYKFLRNTRPDIVHSHVQSFSGIVLAISYLCGVKGRIAHSHNDEVLFESKASLIRKIYLKFCLFLINVFSNTKLACSRKAGFSLFKKDNFKIIYNGINLNNFLEFSEDKRKKFINEFNFSETNIIIGHVGRFEEQKNHHFIIEVAFELYKIDDKFRFVLIGIGPVMDEIKIKIKNMGLESIVVISEGRDDIASIMTNFFDAFLFPSIYEGLGIVLIESQAAGLSSFVSNKIVEEAIVFNELISVMSLDETPVSWAENIFNKYSNTDKSGHYLNNIKKTKYSIHETILNLNNIYYSLYNF